jgi:hypothetical protein
MSVYDEITQAIVAELEKGVPLGEKLVIAFADECCHYVTCE